MYMTIPDVQVGAYADLWRKGRYRPQVLIWSRPMTEETPLCPHPEDLEGCRKALIEALYRKLILQHCIMEGLRRNFPQCRQVLLEGLRGSRSFAEACKQVVLTGYPQDIKTIPDILYEAYHRLVRTMILKQGITQVSQPSVDDVCQEVFLTLHKYLYWGLNVQKNYRPILPKLRSTCYMGS